VIELLLILAILIVAAIWWRRRSTSAAHRLPPPDQTPDEQTLAALRAAGADLSKPTEVNFYLYLPTEGHAHSVAGVARREGYAADVQPPTEGYTTWLCRLTRIMPPHAAEIARATARLEALATSLGGEYDGWEAAVAP
jgi:hypothetical protein